MRGKILTFAIIVLFIGSIIPVLADDSTGVDLTVTILPPSPPHHPNKKPKADAGPNVKIFVGSIIYFSGAGSYDKDGEIVSYSWSFGDGATATGPEASHSYSEPGHYTVTLTVKDDGGAEDSDKCQVKVWEHTVPVMNTFLEMVARARNWVLQTFTPSMNSHLDNEKITNRSNKP